MPLRRNSATRIGVVLIALGIIVVTIAYFSYQYAISSYQNCVSNIYELNCRPDAPAVLWAVPLEVFGGTLTAIGVGLAMVSHLSRLDGKKP